MLNTTLVNRSALTLFARRLGGHLIDTALFYAVVWGTQFTFLRGMVQTSWSGFHFEAYLFTTITLPAILYYALCESSPWQATLGKRLLGLRVTDLAGRRLSARRALLRALFRFLPFEIGHLTFAFPTPIWVNSQDFRIGFVIVLVALMLYLLAVFSNVRQQSVHDLIAGTQVARV